MSVDGNQNYPNVNASDNQNFEICQNCRFKKGISNLYFFTAFFLSLIQLKNSALTYLH